MHEALRLLRRLSAAGVMVPDETKEIVLAARQELKGKGNLEIPTGLALYDAYRDLAVMAARTGDEPDVAIADPYFRAVVNSEFLLKFASESGADVPPQVQADIIAGQSAQAGATDEIKSRFYSAYAVLSKRLGDVTADTIKACRSPRTRRTLKRDEKRAILWAIVAVVTSVLLFTADAINQQLTEEIATANDLAIKLRGAVFPITPPGAQPVMVPEAYLHEDPCDLLKTPGPRAVTSQTELDEIQGFAIAVRGARSRASRLNWFLLNAECNPLDQCWWWQGAHNQQIASKSDDWFRDRFELNPTIGNFTAEFLCKVQTWQDVRFFAVNVQKSYGAIFGGLVGHALPILYALLGAYAYRLRQFSETVRNRTFHPSFADSARLITAIIAGAVAGLFNPVRDLAVSPLAMAFLVGYGVEIFFKFLDYLLSSFANAAPGGSSAPRPVTATSKPEDEQEART
ncbi:MAG TPA: hypothetical protein VFL55_16360 [Acetobacteraceae bacterium]|nr:hypothetical protein [Acetobacteraceae bacterium]